MAASESAIHAARKAGLVAIRKAAARVIVELRRFMFGSPLSFFKRHAQSGFKTWRRVNPEQPCFRFSRISPAMRRGAFEIEAVARLQAMMFVVVQPDFKFAAQDVEKFFAFVGIGLAAAAARLDAEEMRLHRGVAPGEEFHAHAFGGFENLTLRGMDDAGVFLGGLEERKDVGAVVAGDAAKRGDGGTHLAALERTEESYGEAGGAG